MKSDLELIKDKYGENMMHLCRSLFPTLLEKQGLLFHLLKEHFAYSRELYYDIIADNKVENGFKDYIYSLVDLETIEVFSKKSAKELLDDAGYILYECKTYEEMLNFKKYYKKGEQICSFDKEKKRLEDSYVFFAIKKNVDEIKRENFENPKREDEYGTSVISIQFSRGRNNTVSIKNRYNLTVDYPDATFSNNLENIIPGLTTSFERDYHLNINKNEHMVFDAPNYIKANDEKFYKYNYKIEDVYYCIDNMIINQLNEPIKDFQEREKYIVLDYFVLDLVNKEIKLYDDRIEDSFVEGLTKFEKIHIERNRTTGNKTIECITKQKNKVVIEIDSGNRIIGYRNDEVEELGDNFLHKNITLKTLHLKNVTKIGNECLRKNKDLQDIFLPNVEIIGDNCMSENESALVVDLPKATTIGYSAFFFNDSICYLNLPSVIHMGNYSFKNNHCFEHINIPNRKDLEEKFMNQVPKTENKGSIK